MSLTINKTYTTLQETHHRTLAVDTREIPQDRGVGCVCLKSVCDVYDVCLSDASREGEQMPAGHVIPLTLGQSRWQPSQWKQRDAS